MKTLLVIVCLFSAIVSLYAMEDAKITLPSAREINKLLSENDFDYFAEKSGIAYALGGKTVDPVSLFAIVKSARHTCARELAPTMGAHGRSERFALLALPTTDSVVKAISPEAHEWLVQNCARKHK